jgi:hypothetical protein
MMIMEKAALALHASPPLLPANQLPGCKDLISLIGNFWGQLIDAFMEPYGSTEGLLVQKDVWKHHTPTLAFSERFDPYGAYK